MRKDNHISQDTHSFYEDKKYKNDHTPHGGKTHAGRIFVENLYNKEWGSFRMSARVLKKEKTSVDKALTKKQAERSGGNRFEETSSHGITTEYFDIDFRGFHDSCSSTSDPSSKPNLEEGNDVNSYSWEDAIHKVDAKGNSKKDISKATISPMSFGISNN
ncbi:hypothetical protein RhiirC2_781237 [Rhizophagus irregularis]|uniref:Uncharacterized protein n=1 Tax=Rhizophagus irregularis TaxID=588596 RepID=A0A2N1N5S5_9GLOM|nr:hypothetical protein RhiirC2_781237 [Rhizophagus irregularis]